MSVSIQFVLKREVAEEVLLIDFVGVFVLVQGVVVCPYLFQVAILQMLLVLALFMLEVDLAVIEGHQILLLLLVIAEGHLVLESFLFAIVQCHEVPHSDVGLLLWASERLSRDRGLQVKFVFNATGQDAAIPLCSSHGLFTVVVALEAFRARGPAVRDACDSSSVLCICVVEQSHLGHMCILDVNRGEEVLVDALGLRVHQLIVYHSLELLRGAVVLFGVGWSLIISGSLVDIVREGQECRPICCTHVAFPLLLDILIDLSILIRN